MDATEPLCFVVTGANTGIGYQAALELVKAGHEVVMGCRDIDKANQAKTKILSSYPQAAIITMPLDVSDLNSVVNFAKSLKSHITKPFVALINNAGITSTFNDTIIHRLPNGLERTMATNHFGSALLSLLLMDTLKETAREKHTTVRCVNVVSRLHNIEVCRKTGNEVQLVNLTDLNYCNEPTRYNGAQAYKDSKAAMIMFANQLSTLVGDNFEVYSICPGFIPGTELGRENGRLKMAMIQFITGYVLPLFGKNITVSVESAGVAIAQMAMGQLRSAGTCVSNFKSFYFENSGLNKVESCQPSGECVDAARCSQCYEETVRILKDTANGIDFPCPNSAVDSN